jgi:hypothetical protein
MNTSCKMTHTYTDQRILLFGKEGWGIILIAHKRAMPLIWRSTQNVKMETKSSKNGLYSKLGFEYTLNDFIRLKSKVRWVEGTPLGKILPWKYFFLKTNVTGFGYFPLNSFAHITSQSKQVAPLFWNNMFLNGLDSFAYIRHFHSWAN